MAKIYKVWIEIEEIDEENDHYESVSLSFSQVATFATVEQATKYAEELYEVGGSLI